MNQLDILKDDKRFRKIKIGLYLLFFFVCAAIYWIFIGFANNDLATHIEYTITVHKGERLYPPTFLLYLLLGLFTGFSKKFIALKIVEVVMISLATTAKLYLIDRYLGKYTNLKQDRALVFALSLMLVLCIAVVDPFNLFLSYRWQLGKVSPTVWYSTTTILMFPFSILLFEKQLAYFEKNYKNLNKLLLQICGLVLINAAIKPSFLLAYLPITGLFLLRDINFKKLVNTVKIYSPIIVGLLIIYLQSVLIYEFQVGSYYTEENSLKITPPFEQFLFFVPSYYLPFALLTSFIFPLSVILFYRNILKFFPFKFTGSLMIAALLLAAFFGESGGHNDAPNFLWQNYICSFLLFAATLAFLLKEKIFQSKPNWKMIIVSIFFFLHFISGLGYLFKCLLLENFS